MSGAEIDHDDEGNPAPRKPTTLELAYTAYDMSPLAHDLGDEGSRSVGTRTAARCCAAVRAAVREHRHRFTHLAIASGDYLLAEEAAHLAAHGVLATVVTRRSSLSPRLALAAREVIFLDTAAEAA